MLFRGAPSEMAEKLARVDQPFSIWTEGSSGILAARDHLGIAPMYYARGGPDGWTIATTVGEIIDRLPATGSRLDERAIVAHVAGLVPGPHATFFSRIRAVEPGVLMRVTPESIHSTPFWDPNHIEQRKGIELESAADGLRDLIFEVVADHVDDRPVAVALSSGLGSTIVLAALVEADADVEAITWTSPDVPESNEGRWARLVARKLGVELTELQMTVDELLPETGVVTRRSTPRFDPLDHMWRVTAGTVADMGRRALYTGHGADRLFGGRIPAAADLLLALRPGAVREHLARKRIDEPGAHVRDELLGPIARQIVPGLARRRHKPVPWLDGSRRGVWQAIIRESTVSGMLPGRALRISKLVGGEISQRSEELTAQGRPDDVEIRQPLLDRRLVEFALGLPSWLIDDGRTDKLVLREAMRGVLPDEVIELEEIRSDAVIREAMRTRGSQLLGLAHNTRSADLGYVNEPLLFDRVASFLRGEHDDVSFWNALTLEDWLRRWR